MRVGEVYYDKYRNVYVTIEKIIDTGVYFSGYENLGYLYENDGSVEFNIKWTEKKIRDKELILQYEKLKVGDIYYDTGEDVYVTVERVNEYNVWFSGYDGLGYILDYEGLIRISLITIKLGLRHKEIILVENNQELNEILKQNGISYKNKR